MFGNNKLPKKSEILPYDGKLEIDLGEGEWKNSIIKTLQVSENSPENYTDPEKSYSRHGAGEGIDPTSQYNQKYKGETPLFQQKQEGNKFNDSNFDYNFNEELIDLQDEVFNLQDKLYKLEEKFKKVLKRDEYKTELKTTKNEKREKLLNNRITYLRVGTYDKNELKKEILEIEYKIELKSEEIKNKKIEIIKEKIQR